MDSHCIVISVDPYKIIPIPKMRSIPAKDKNKKVIGKLKNKFNDVPLFEFRGLRT